MDTMPAMNSQVIRAAGLALIALLGLLANMIWGTNTDQFQAAGSKILEASLTLLATGSTLWALYARAFKANPPITQTAADQHAAIVAGQVTSNVLKAPPAAVLVLLMPLLLFAPIVGAVLLQGCATEPVNAAKTVDQKAAALLGDFNIYAAAAVTIGTNPGVPAAARKALLQAVVTAKPFADSLDGALRLYRQASAALAAGTTTADKVTIAATNLTNWLTQLEPMVTNLENAAKAAEVP